MIRIETNTLKDILSKVGKCASNDRTAVFTQLMRICAKGNYLQFTTTNDIDTCVYTYCVSDGRAEFPDFDATVMVDQFIKLVSKFTSPYTEFTLSDSGNEIIINGNGSYKLALPLDNGRPIAYRAITASLDNASPVYIGPAYNIVAAAKCTEGSITKITSDLPDADFPRTNFFFNNTGCITLDGFKASWYRDEDLLQFDALMYPSTIKMLSVVDSTGKDIKAYKSTSGEFIFKNDVITLISKEARGCDVFPYEAATALIDSPIAAAVQIAPGHLLAALDRLKLFITSEDDNCIKMKFSHDGLFIYTCSGACCEQISAEALEYFECFIDIDNFVSQLKAFDSDMPITLGYDNEAFIQLEGDGLGQIIVLSDVA